MKAKKLALPRVVAAIVVGLSQVGSTAWANGIELGSLALDGTLNSAAASATGTVVLSGDDGNLALSLDVTGTLPQFNLPAYQLTDVFVSFTLRNDSTASISSYEYDPDRTGGQLLEVIGNLGAVLDRVSVAGRDFDFIDVLDVAGCAGEIAPSATIACGVAAVAESGSLTFGPMDDLSAFIGADTLDALGEAGSAFLFDVSSVFFYPIDGRVDGTVAFSELRVRYGYFCRSDPSNLDACADDGDGDNGNGSVPEPGSLALLASGAIALLAGRRRRRSTGFDPKPT